MVSHGSREQVPFRPAILLHTKVKPQRCPTINWDFPGGPSILTPQFPDVGSCNLLEVIYAEETFCSMRAAGLCDRRRWPEHSTRKFDSTAGASGERRSVFSAGGDRQICDGATALHSARVALANPERMLRHFTDCSAETPASTPDSPADSPED